MTTALVRNDGTDKDDNEYVSFEMHIEQMAELNDTLDNEVWMDEYESTLTAEGIDADGMYYLLDDTHQSIYQAASREKSTS